MSEESSLAQSELEWQLHWGRLLRTARQVAGLSLTELSATTGLSKGYLSKLESAHPAASNPSRATLSALGRALPSFRPLAYTLDASTQLGSLALGQQPPHVPEVIVEGDGTVEDSPVRLGWRELEVVIALLTLEHAALPQPLTAVVLARSVGRGMREVDAVLRDLVRMRVLSCHPPTRPGGSLTYRRAPDFESRVGIAHIGDALILAAALLAQAPVARRHGARKAIATDRRFPDEGL